MTASDITIDVGEEQVIIGARCRGARISVLVDGSERVDEYDLEDAFADLGREIGHYTFVGGSLFEKRSGNARPEENGIVTDGGSKYSTPTGYGYLGVWSTSAWTVDIAIDTIESADWRSDDEVFVIQDEPGISLVTNPPESIVSDPEAYLAKANVRDATVGTAVTVPGRALRHVEGFAPGEDIRLYKLPEGGLTLVASRADPFVDEDIVTDGGIVEPTESPTQLATNRPKERRLLSAIFAFTVAIHGPLDILLTAAAWELETNPLVLNLGFWPWIGVKLGALCLAAFIWWDAPRVNPRPYILEAVAGLAIIGGFGLSLVFLNIALLMGVLG